MKMIWILMTIGLTFAEKLDRTYLPPPGSSFSRSSPGDINVPLELPKTNYSSNDEGFSKTPELVIGINRVGPNQAADAVEDVSIRKSVIANNINSFFAQTNVPSSVFKASSPFLKLEEDSIPTIPKDIYNSDYQPNDFKNSQQIYNVEKQPSIFYDEKNKVYLPSYGGDNTDYVPFITLPPPIDNDKGISNEYKYIQTDMAINKDMPSLKPIGEQFNAIFSTLSTDYPFNSNRNITPYSSTAFEISATTPISSIKGEPPIYYNGKQIPERIQAQADRQAVILNYDQTKTPEGYAYSYDTSNGIHGDEEGIAIDGVKAKGSYSYIGDDGILYQVEYTADENGFIPKGAHLPTAPPIPDEILKVIEQAARDKEAGIYDDGSYNEEKYGYKKYQGGYSKTNTNIINKANFLPENERNIEEGHFENGIENPGENTKNYFNSDINSIESSQNNNHSDNDDGNNILPSNNIVLDENYKPLSKSDLDVSKSDKTHKMNSQTASGYEYFPPQFAFYDTNKLKPFPFRFSGIENQDSQPETKEDNIEKVTAKPFLTPYVIRKGDDTEINDYDEQFGNEQQETDFDEETIRNRSKENYRHGPNDFGNKDKYQESFGASQNDKPRNIDGEIDSREFSPGNKEQLGLEEQLGKYGDKIQNDEGYFYQNTSKPFITLSPRVSYTTSTAASTRFPAGSTEDVNSSPISSPSLFQPPSFSTTTSFIDAFSTKIPSMSSSLTNTISPIILDNESTSIFLDANSKIDSLSTPEITQTSRPKLVPGVTRFGMSYRPTTESSKYVNLDDSQTIPDDIIGEDFYGPKQAQRFDPITGYYY